MYCGNSMPVLQKKMFNGRILKFMYLSYPLGFNMHICWVNPSIMWFPHWALHFTAFDGCPRAISAWWVIFSVTTFQPLFWFISSVCLVCSKGIYSWVAWIYLILSIIMCLDTYWILNILCSDESIGWAFRKKSLLGISGGAGTNWR